MELSQRFVLVLFMPMIYCVTVVESQNLPCFLLELISEVFDCAGISWVLCYVLGMLSLVFQCQFTGVLISDAPRLGLDSVDARPISL
ncbi:hypothetical protein ElyMa_000591800 [Elysia marginata]|uniref:Uncharacterized protein n=1 Tax=Elysia marginata TaxID=1093978 RepID=A0AAV4G780_9GAST|nr:hypothetical protein ElyMa_000591800 [Elysia marginata]